MSKNEKEDQCVSELTVQGAKSMILAKPMMLSLFAVQYGMLYSLTGLYHSLKYRLQTHRSEKKERKVISYE